MRNYIGLSEFKKSEQVYKLEFFDDEFFVILKNNTPVYIAFPTILDKEFEENFNYSVEISSARNIISKGIKIEPNEILHIVRNNKKYYNIISYSKKGSDFIENTLLSKIKKEHLNILKK